MNSLFEKTLLDYTEKLCAVFDLMAVEEKVEALNLIRQRLHEVSPFHDEPVDCVLWVDAGSVQANDYNPNRVAPPEMRLLEHSMVMDGITQPVVAYPEQEEDRDYTVIDGFHRTRVCKECRRVRDRVHGYVPISVINDHRHDLRDRMSATIRHNRARGVHAVVPMVDIVVNLIREGWTDSEIAKELGMDADEVLRFKQSSGLPELFKDCEYSRAWE